jgi:GT2 family glycosyltransferase
MAFKRSLYDELGEFDESLWPSSGEEIDFCLKAKQAGKKVGIAIDVYVHHEGSVTFKDMNAEHPYRDIIEKSEKHIKDKWGSAYESQGVDA